MKNHSPDNLMVIHKDNNPAEELYRTKRIAHWDGVARKGRIGNCGLRSNYQKHLHAMYRFLIPEGLRVLEVGCAEGELLAVLKPEIGVGVDFSAAMLKVARDCHSGLYFVEADVHRLVPDLAPELSNKPFDVIILSDLINDLWDVLETLSHLKPFCAAHTRMVINFQSHLWEHPFQLLQNHSNITPRLAQNWFTPADLRNLLYLAGFEVIQAFDDFLWPWQTPLITRLCNRYLSKLWPFSILDLTHFMLCRPAARPLVTPSVSVVIPARNESGNIEAALQRTPEMGSETEIIFVEGNSTDDTWDVIRDMANKYKHRKIKMLRQPGKGKGDAVRTGFDAAEGEILMILDADLTMPPESLPQFYDVITTGKAEFVNGVRLVYPQEKKAMRFLNLLGNKFFSLAFSWMLGLPIKDTLCGTKVLSREIYRKIVANRSYFGDFDPFGDFDLLFGAAKLNLKIIDLPVRYRERTYGDTNISRWRDGWLLLRMLAFAARRIKFKP